MAKQIWILSAATVLLAGCGFHGAQSQGTQQMPPPKVTVAAVSEKNVVEWREFTGRTEAVETVEVRPRVSGHIQMCCS
jgi:multidrug efflux system membrane fusion protein